MVASLNDDDFSSIVARRERHAKWYGGSGGSFESSVATMKEDKVLELWKKQETVGVHFEWFIRWVRKVRGTGRVGI